MKQHMRAQHAVWANLTADAHGDTLLDLGTDIPSVVGAFVAVPGESGGLLQVLHGFLRHRDNGLNRGKVHTCLNDVAGMDTDIIKPLGAVINAANQVRVLETVDR